MNSTTAEFSKSQIAELEYNILMVNYYHKISRMETTFMPFTTFNMY